MQFEVAADAEPDQLFRVELRRHDTLVEAEQLAVERARSLRLPGGIAIDKPDGFHDILSKLRSMTIAFERPVVLVHGDSHYFMIDKPPLFASTRSR